MRTTGERNAWTQCEASPNVHVMGRASGTLRPGRSGFAHCTVARNRGAEKRGASIERFAGSLLFPDGTARVHRSDFHAADARAGLPFPSDHTRRMRQPSRETKCRFQRVPPPFRCRPPPRRGSLSPQMGKRKRRRVITILGHRVFVFLTRRHENGWDMPPIGCLAGSATRSFPIHRRARSPRRPLRSPKRQVALASMDRFQPNHGSALSTAGRNTGVGGRTGRAVALAGTPTASRLAMRESGSRPSRNPRNKARRRAFRLVAPVSPGLSSGLLSMPAHA